MAMVLKLDGRNKQGRCWKELNTCGKPINQGAIIGGKMCSNCNQCPDFEKQVIKCMKCNHSFHIECLLIPINEEYVQNISQNPSMWWFCLSCMSVKLNDAASDNQMSESTTTMQPDILLQNTLTTFKKDMLTLITETIDRKFNDFNKASHVIANTHDTAIPPENENKNAWSNCDPAPQSLPSTEYPVLGADANNNENPESKKVEKHVLLLEPSGSGAEVVKAADFKKRTVQNVNKAIRGINVNFCSVKKSGVVAIGFNDIESKRNAEKQIKDSNEISDYFCTRSPKQLLPKVTLLGINEVIFDDCSNKDEMKTALLEDILLRNDYIREVLDASSDESLDVLMIQKSMPSDHFVSYSALLKMSSNVRKVIHKNANKLYVSLSRCRVVDKYQILQCYHCQKPGHHSKNCPKKDDDPTCLYCGDSHTSKDCSDKSKKCCVNCLHSSNSLHRSHAHNHNAASVQCPILKPLRETIKQKTESWNAKK